MPRTSSEKHELREAGWKKTFLWFLLLFGLMLAYTILRYMVGRGIGIEHLPLYLSNKAFATVAVALIGISFLIGPLCRLSKRFAPLLYLRKYFGVFGFGIAALHGVISLLLFNPAYYPRFFLEAGKLTLEGELSMLFGILAVFIFAAVSVTSLPSVEAGMRPDQWKFVQRLGYLAFFLTLLHVLVMGFGGWLTPATWPLGLPPITMIASVIILFVIFVRLLVAAFPRR